MQLSQKKFFFSNYFWIFEIYIKLGTSSKKNMTVIADVFPKHVFR